MVAVYMPQPFTVARFLLAGQGGKEGASHDAQRERGGEGGRREEEGRGGDLGQSVQVLYSRLAGTS